MFLRSRMRALAAERHHTALLLGLVSIPVTAAINGVYAPEPVSATPLGVACLLAGALAVRGAASGHSAGEVAAIAGSPPVLVVNAWRAFVEWTSYAPLVARLGDTFTTVVAVGAALVTVAILLVVLVVAGHVLGRVGAWVGERAAGRARR